MRCEIYCLLYILCVLSISRTTVKIILVYMVMEIERARWRLPVNSVGLSVTKAKEDWEQACEIDRDVNYLYVYRLYTKHCF